MRPFCVDPSQLPRPSVASLKLLLKLLDPKQLSCTGHVQWVRHVCWYGANKSLTFSCRFNEAECECPGVLALGVHVYACMHYTPVCILSVYVGYMALAIVTQILYNCIYYTICLYCISNCNFVFVSCSQSCLHLPLPHLGPIPDVKTTPSSPEAKIQPAGRNSAM